MKINWDQVNKYIAQILAEQFVHNNTTDILAAIEKASRKFGFSLDEYMRLNDGPS